MEVQISENRIFDKPAWGLNSLLLTHNSNTRSLLPTHISMFMQEREANKDAGKFYEKIHASTNGTRADSISSVDLNVVFSKSWQGHRVGDLYSQQHLPAFNVFFCWRIPATTG